MVDYLNFAKMVGGTQSPLESLQKGQDIGLARQLQAQQIQSAMAQQQMAAQQQQMDMQRKQQQAEAMQRLMSTPNPSARDIFNASLLMDKDTAESMRKGFDVLDKDTQKSNLEANGKVLSAFEVGKPEYASELLKNKAEAARNSGDEQIAKFYDVLAQNALENPHATKLTIGILTSHMPGGKDVMEAVGKRGEEVRKQEIHPLELKKQEGELKQQAEQLGLTKAQTNEALVRAKNLSTEGKKLALEFESMKAGGSNVPPEKRFDFEQKLRKEYNDQTGDFQTVRSSYQRILQSENTPAGDIALIFNYMKMLDPGSVVREGEFATAANAGGIPTKIQNMYNKAMSGERLTPEQRVMFSNQAKSLYSGAQTREKEVRKGIDRVVKNYGLNESNIFYEEGEATTPTKKDVAPKNTSAIPPDIAALLAKHGGK